MISIVLTNREMPPFEKGLACVTIYWPGGPYTAPGVISLGAFYPWRRYMASTDHAEHGHSLSNAREQTDCKAFHFPLWKLMHGVKLMKSGPILKANIWGHALLLTEMMDLMTGNISVQVRHDLQSIVDVVDDSMEIISIVEEIIYIKFVQ